MIINTTILQYNILDIKRALDTKISELSNDGVYDYTTDQTILSGSYIIIDEIGQKLELDSYININEVGQKVELDLNSSNIIIGNGPGEANISAYIFNPSDFNVLMNKNFSFYYSSTNAKRVYLKKQSDQYYFKEIELFGKYTIENITQDEIYTLNAEDFNGQLKTCIFNIKIKEIQPDITKFTLHELLMYAVSVIQELQTSGDVIIEPSSPINSKIQIYIKEANETTSESSNDAIWYLLKSIDEEVLKVFIKGIVDSPKVLLFDNTSLKSKVVSLSEEIEKVIKNAGTRKITGNVRTNTNLPMSGVKILTTDNKYNTTTDLQGNYTTSVNYYYNGVLIPYFNGYKFDPEIKDYKNSAVILDIEQDFVGTYIGNNSNGSGSNGGTGGNGGGTGGTGGNGGNGTSGTGGTLIPNESLLTVKLNGLYEQSYNINAVTIKDEQNLNFEIKAVNGETSILYSSLKGNSIKININKYIGIYTYNNINVIVNINGKIFNPQKISNTEYIISMAENNASIYIEVQFNL